MFTRYIVCDIYAKVTSYTQLTNCQHTKLYSFQNRSVGFIFNISSSFAKFQPRYSYKKERGYYSIDVQYLVSTLLVCQGLLGLSKHVSIKARSCSGHMTRNMTLSVYAATYYFANHTHVNSKADKTNVYLRRR